MHLRSAACRGAAYSTDQSTTAHGSHQFFPDQWGPATGCPGWTEDELYARALTERLMTCPAGTRLEASPAVLAAVNRLLVPDYPGEGEHVEHQLAQLFGVPLFAARLRPGEWRLVGPGGTVIDAGHGG